MARLMDDLRLVKKVLYYHIYSYHALLWVPIILAIFIGELILVTIYVWTGKSLFEFI